MTTTENFRTIRSWNSLITEEIVLVLLAYGVFAAYAAEWISFWVMQSLMMVYMFRIFTLRHERSHSGILTTRKALLLNLLDFHHSPFQEPVNGGMSKHLDHHRAHLATRKFSLTENPHGYLDHSFFISLLSAIFYEEFMFILDARREGGLSHERRIQLVVSTFVLAFLFMIVNVKTMLLFFLAYRIALAATWFSFSYVLHLPFFYEKQLGEHLPQFMKTGIEWVFGSGFVTAVFYHRFHHAKPKTFYKV